MRGKSFALTVVVHWNRLPKGVVDALSLQAFKARLDVALGSLVCWLATCTQQGVGTRWSLWSFSTQAILGFHDLVLRLLACLGQTGQRGIVWCHVCALEQSERQQHAYFI